MLDNETKQRINTARDILVGKVPDPKSQVEQITIALTYKFMDDMDQEALAMDGKASFFVGEYEKYGWTKMFDPHLGGFEMLALYSEAITRMSENPHIEPLFRQIFKNAYLPYRDPETLKLFLKTINEFHYDHSEKLGDAFEYLLSVLGSQGDAGQFRTPRHIIEFMVAVVAPKKHETILDPACGTAGFLISAYKFIRQSNTEKVPGDLLNVQDRARMVNNFSGYDISPDMVRLSLVNMYLHGFTNPRIHEYDTLTSEERWHEYADVILANPPFMSPKGGIRPHKKFSVQSKRSEVLFVDYMAEHLTASGRAAIIVPEGIIFQSGTAYKELRKYLVEKNYLWAVVSLPSGVFQPYSGVKTSILFMDKVLARKTNQILFVKVENDGFDLGAQRRPIDKNDLPAAQALMQAWQQAVVEKGGEGFDMDPYAGVSALLVEKSKVAENGEYNLTGERYRETKKQNGKIPLVKLGDICEIVSGVGFPLDQQGLSDEVIPFLKVSDMNILGNEIFIKSWNNSVSENIAKFLKGRICPPGTIIFPKIGAAIATNKKRILTKPSLFDNNVMGFMPGGIVDSAFLFYVLQQINLSDWASDSQPPSMKKSFVSEQVIPLPPLEVQREIVAEIEGYQRIIDGARMVVENWKPNLEIRDDIKLVNLGEFISYISGLTLSIPECVNENGIPIISINNIKEDGSITLDGIRKISIPKNKKPNFLKKGDLLFNWRNGSKKLVGKTGYFDLEGEYVFASFLLGIRVNKDFLDPEWLWYLLNNYRKEEKYMQFMRQNVNGLFNREELNILDIPLPSIIEQKETLLKINEEKEIVDANKKLIALYEKKINNVIDRIWEV